MSTGRPTLHNVQALRGVAAVMVVLAHVSAPAGFEDRAFGSRWNPWSTLPGDTGVDLFFVISGLIMTVTTWRSFGTPGAARAFLRRRVTRIYPLYWLVTSAVLVLLLLGLGSATWDFHDVRGLVSSYLLLPQIGRKVLIVGWTLVYELYFYLVFALAIRLGRRWFPWLLGAWCAATLVLHATVTPGDQAFLRLVSSPLSLEFVFGVLIGRAVIRAMFPAPEVALAVGCVAVAGVLVWLAREGSSGRTEFSSDAVRVAGPGVAMALLVYGAVAVEQTRHRVAPAFLQRWGDASYSLYLLHLPVLTFLGTLLARLVRPHPAVHAAMIVIGPACALLAALLCYRFVERPIQRFLHRGPRSEARPDAGSEARPDAVDVRATPADAPVGAESLAAPGPPER